MGDLQRYFSIEEFSSYTSLSRMTIFRRIQDKSLPSIKIGRRRLIPENALEVFAESLASEEGGAK